jgi:hypothetical protein
MKNWIGSAVSGLVFVLQAGCSVLGIRTVEEARYKVVLQDGRFQVRQYADAAVAETVVDADYEKAQSIAFRRLAGYIFGKNKSKQQIPMTAPVIQERANEKIAMTAPVLQEKSDRGWQMTFVLPSKYTIASLPEPLDGEVTIREQKGRRAAVLRYSGALSEAAMNVRIKELQDWLKQNGYRAISEPRLAGYDPPWTLAFLRRNEILIDIEE